MSKKKTFSRKTLLTFLSDDHDEGDHHHGKKFHGKKFATSPTTPALYTTNVVSTLVQNFAKKW